MNKSLPESKFRLIRMLDFFFLLRPVLLIPYWTFFLLGYYQALVNDKLGLRIIWPLQWEVIPILLVGTLFFGIVYILNQITDREADKINDKLFFIPRGIISIQAAYTEASVLFAISLVVLLLMKIDPLRLLLVSSILIVGIFYSVKPFRFKARPVVDALSNCLVYGWTIFALGWMMVTGDDFWEGSRQALPYICAVMAVFLNTTLVDIKGDRAEGLCTTGIWLGETTSSILSVVFIALAIGLSIWLGNWIVLIPAVVSLPLYVLAAIRKTKKSYLLSLQLPGRLLVLISGILFPIYLGFLVLLYFLTKWYYRRRFDFDYP